jgi:polysaccharide biosynthesis protein PslG
MASLLDRSAEFDLTFWSVSRALISVRIGGLEAMTWTKPKGLGVGRAIGLIVLMICPIFRCDSVCGAAPAQPSQVASNKIGAQAPGDSGAAQWLGCNSSGRADAIGINVNNLNWEALSVPNVISALKQSGVGWVRINMYWAWTERQPGVYDWQAVDSGLAQLEAAKINVVVTLDGPLPCWVLATMSTEKCTGPRWTVPPTKLWVDYVSTAVSRYRGRIRYWELWNEPDLIYSLDLPTAEQRWTQYRNQILIPGAQAVHQNDPDAKVVAPVLAAMVSGGSEPGPSLVRALTTILSGPVAANVDVVSLHSYYPMQSAEKAKSAREAMTTLGMAHKPLWITEFGWGNQFSQTGNLTSPPPSDQHHQQGQADFLDSEIKSTLGRGMASKVFWFALTDTPRDKAGDHGNNYGLIDNKNYTTYEWTPRPPFLVLEHLISQACK